MLAYPTESEHLKFIRDGRVVGKDDLIGQPIKLPMPERCLFDLPRRPPAGN